MRLGRLSVLKQIDISVLLFKMYFSLTGFSHFLLWMLFVRSVPCYFLSSFSSIYLPWFCRFLVAIQSTNCIGEKTTGAMRIARMSTGMSSDLVLCPLITCISWNVLATRNSHQGNLIVMGTLSWAHHLEFWIMGRLVEVRTLNTPLTSKWWSMLF